MHRLITFLGIGNLQETSYHFRGNLKKTKLVSLALQSILDHTPEETVVLATDKAMEKNRNCLEKEFIDEGRERPRFVRIPEGRTSDELWEQFQIIKDELHKGKPKMVTIDITHALRHQPFFAAGVIGFVRSIDEDDLDFRVVYGAFDLRDQHQNITPVIELTPFVELLDWTRDLVLFLESGRLGKLIQWVRKPGRELGKAWERGVKLATAIERFARDLQTVRTGALLLGGEDRGRRTPSSAKRLLQATREARQDVAEHLPPLADVLERIEAMARPLVFNGDHLAGAHGHEVLAALVELYLSMGRYVEAVTTLREARISAFASPAAARPGLPGFDAGERDHTEKVLWPEAEKDERRSISDLRNDISHAGYRRDSCDSNNLIDNIQKKSAEYSAWTPPEIPHADRILVNITNHPWDEWPEEQRRAALELAGRIVDIDFPRVGPDWSLRRIEEEARKIIQKLPPGTTHALVQGEFTLTMELVRRLQARGIRCLAATTERRVERQPDGSEVRRFEFVRFRDYPKLA